MENPRRWTIITDNETDEISFKFGCFRCCSITICIENTKWPIQDQVVYFLYR